MRTGSLSAAVLAALLATGADLAAAEVPQSPVDAAVREFRRKVPLNAPQLEDDPYALGAARPSAVPADAVCAVRYEADKIHYRLETFDGEAAAIAAGYVVTHGGGCGTCSTLQDLAAYLARPDLTTPVRSCAMRSLTHRWTVSCLENLGLSHDCAETFYYNSANTRRQCFKVCLASFLKGEPSNRPDGSMNACLQCDEDNSGRIFEMIAGRTRRNSGIRSSIDRPQSEIYPVTHDYY